MITKIAHIAVTILAAMALGPAAFAAPEYGPKQPHGSKTKPTPNCCVAAPCKGVDCCTTKMVMTGYTGNHNQIPVYRKVIDCKGNCPVTVNDQKAVCSRGSRA